MVQYVSFAIAKMNSRNFFSQENDLVYCTDVWSAREALGNQHDPTEWRLFIDFSQSSLKAVLLHNGNKFPFVPPNPFR